VEYLTGIGFNQNFLSVVIKPPNLSASNKENVFTIHGSEVIDYTHFSLAINKIRRFAFWVAWNIDGRSISKLSRKGIPFITDPRVPSEFQVGDDLYKGNRLDRGHIARRADLLWGEPAEAERANKDSFYFTNITPQMDDFNQGQRGGLWGRLEDAVFEDTEVENLKVSLFGGPVFRDDDRNFINVKIPREFWKVIVFVENGKLKTKAFLLAQNLDQLRAFELDAFKVYQIGLEEVEERCGLVFPDILKEADSVGRRLKSQREIVSQRRPLESLEDIDWS
jgi:endonuclease G